MQTFASKDKVNVKKSITICKDIIKTLGFRGKIDNLKVKKKKNDIQKLISGVHLNLSSKLTLKSRL
jgi:hypothetical protein